MTGNVISCYTKKVPHSKHAVRDEFSSSRGSTLLDLIKNKIRPTSFSTITESPDCFTATQRQSSEGSVDKKLSACGFSLWYHVPNLLVSSSCFHMSHYIIEDVVVKKFSATFILEPYRCDNPQISVDCILQVLTAALLVFLTRTTRTWIISSNLLLLADCCRFLLLFVKLLQLFLRINLFPLWKFI